MAPIPAALPSGRKTCIMAAYSQNKFQGKKDPAKSMRWFHSFRVESVTPTALYGYGHVLTKTYEAMIPFE